MKKDKNMKMKDYVSDNGEYIIPVSWEVYSTVKVKGAKNLEEAFEYAQEHMDSIPLGEGEYIDGSYKIDIETDDEGIQAQNYGNFGQVSISCEEE